MASSPCTRHVVDDETKKWSFVEDVRLSTVISRTTLPSDRRARAPAIFVDGVLYVETVGVQVSGTVGRCRLPGTARHGLVHQPPVGIDQRP